MFICSSPCDNDSTWISCQCTHAKCIKLTTEVLAFNFFVQNVAFICVLQTSCVKKIEKDDKLVFMVVIIILVTRA